MAVVQISRIQIRRGQKNRGEGVPQLASGELAWAIDTQELFIGNGSLVEGAPAVGNTKILTAEDDIFTLANTYTYKKEYPYITTGESPSSPVSRTLQDRLDDFVSIRSFGATGDPNQDATPILQKAIDQLFVNPATKGQEQSRVILYIDPGVYTINNTLYIPPFASIVGAGPERTVIISTANYTMLTVNEESLPEAPAFEDSESPSAATTYGNQPRNILLKGLTLKNTNGIGLYLASCRNSIFEDLDFVGAWTFGSSIPPIDTVNNPTDVGILVKSLSRSVRSHNNLFTRCKLLNWAYGIVGINDVNNNLIESCNFNTLGQGINLGSQWQNDSNGEQEIPSNNKVINSSFISVHSEAIKIVKGSFNISQNNFFKEVGNDTVDFSHSFTVDYSGGAAGTSLDNVNLDQFSINNGTGATASVNLNLPADYANFQPADSLYLGEAATNFSNVQMNGSSNSPIGSIGNLSFTVDQYVDAGGVKANSINGQRTGVMPARN